MSKTMSNGSGRKQLSDQLDRLDTIIDALDVALPGAVRDAVEVAAGLAIKEALQGVLLELLTNPTLRQTFQQSPPPDETRGRPKGSPLSRLWGRVCSTARCCAEGIGTALRAACLGWAVCGNRTKTIALAAVAGVIAVIVSAHSHIASAATSVCKFGRKVIQNAGRSLSRIVPALPR